MCAHVHVPYGLWTADDTLQDLISDLLPVVLMDVEGKDNLPDRWFPVLPVLTHHVLQVDCSYTHRDNHSTRSDHHHTGHIANIASHCSFIYVLLQITKTPFKTLVC